MVNKLLSQSPVSTVLNTSFVERINGTFRALRSCLVRKSYSFSKNSISHDAHVVIVTSYYNFIKPHRTLTKKFGEEATPAMAANPLITAGDGRIYVTFPLIVSQIRTPPRIIL